MKNLIANRLESENLNCQGCLIKVIEYINSNNIKVEFQDKYRTIVSSTWANFSTGNIKNPYFPTVCGVGIKGNKYYSSKNYQKQKEYSIWKGILRRCYSKIRNKHQQTYKDVTVCDEWLLYENFYEWLHSQDNFDKWLNNDSWSVDKDILIKGNKIYSPETCCLVPQSVNMLFMNKFSCRGELPIGVSKDSKNPNKYIVRCSNIDNKLVCIGFTDSPIKGFYIYKEYKENIIKQVAKMEYDKGNITERCYNAMINYQVDVTD